MSSSRKTAEWLEHQYFRTYRIADFAEAVASEPFAFINGLLQNLMANDGILGFLPNWQQFSALHRFVAFIADEMFMSDCDGPRLFDLQPDERERRLVLPVDAALARYGISDDPFFPPESLRDADADPGKLADAYYDHFQEVRMGADYEWLLRSIADEVFFVMFTNRTALYALNRFLAMYVRDLDPEGFDIDDDDLGALFKAEGQLARKPPPKWARRAVFFRERGMCAECQTNLSGLLSTLSVRHFDHMVPLARGGLNDVTNLQLLCDRCNRDKSSDDREPSRRVQHWYRMSA